MTLPLSYRIEGAEGVQTPLSGQAPLAKIDLPNGRKVSAWAGQEKAEWRAVNLVAKENFALVITNPPPKIRCLAWIGICFEEYVLETQDREFDRSFEFTPQKTSYTDEHRYDDRVTSSDDTLALPAFNFQYSIHRVHEFIKRCLPSFPTELAALVVVHAYDLKLNVVLGCDRGCMMLTIRHKSPKDEKSPALKT